MDNGVKVGQFDSNGEEPLTIQLGDGLIVGLCLSFVNEDIRFEMSFSGLTMGLRGMCEGEMRHVLIPPNLAFDDKKRFPNVIKFLSYFHFTFFSKRKKITN
jgi:hypothetical protein